MKIGLKVLENKIIVVIGSEGLLGRPFVKAIHNSGGIPICVDILDTPFSDFEYIKSDITKKDNVTYIISQVKTKYGKIDAVVNTVLAPV